jgi:hypothetical protein
MDPSFKPFSTDSDELLVSGWLLSAFEFGQLRMSAGDYLDIAARARLLLSGCCVATLLRMRRDGPRALREIVESVLFERRVFDPPTHDPERIHALKVCDALVSRLVKSNS